MQEIIGQELVNQGDQGKASMEGTMIMAKIVHDQSKFILLVVHPDTTPGRMEHTTTLVHIYLKQVIPLDMVEWHHQISEIVAHQLSKSTTNVKSL